MYVSSTMLSIVYLLVFIIVIRWDITLARQMPWEWFLQHTGEQIEDSVTEIHLFS